MEDVAICLDTIITQKLIEIIKLKEINNASSNGFGFDSDSINFYVREDGKQTKITVLYRDLLIWRPIYHIKWFYTEDFKEKLNVYLGKVIDKLELEIPAELCEEVKYWFDFNS